MAPHSSASDDDCDSVVFALVSPREPPPETVVIDGAVGDVLSLCLSSTLRLIKMDLDMAIRAASGFNLHKSCQLSEDVVSYCHTILRSGSAGTNPLNWNDLMNKRISASYVEQHGDLVWLDDKVGQVSITRALCEGRQLHLPIYAEAALGDSIAYERFEAAVREHISLNEPIVIKPRHGSNSKHVALWSRPQEAGEAAVLKSASKAVSSTDRTWRKESWNQNAVVKGVVLQPLYAAICSCVDCGLDQSAMLRRPLELKVMVLFGEVIGGNINAYTANYVWVSRNGAIHLWDAQARHFLKRHHGAFDPLPHALVELLQRVLRRDWLQLRADSELLARSAGLDEVRVDWLVGDERWGPRIGETTYLGTFALDMQPASALLAQSFATAHLARLHGSVL